MRASVRMLAGRYRLENLLGRGGMGEVWRATDAELDRAVAVKLLSTALSGRDLQDARTRMKREGQAAARLNHPAIATIYDMGDDRAQFFLVYELIVGEDLSTFLVGQPGGRMSHGQIITLGRQIVDGLEHAHEAGVIHRDIKPSNIMLNERGRAKICDFGIANVTDASKVTLQGAIVGTPAYMAPEQFGGGPVTGSTDVYALGASLFTLVTGEPVFRGDNMAAVLGQHVTATPRNPVGLVPGCPAELGDLIVAMLGKDPGDRPSLSSIAGALESLADSLSSTERKSDFPVVPVRQPTPPPPETLPSRNQHLHVTYSSPDAPLLTNVWLVVFRKGEIDSRESINSREINALAFSHDGSRLLIGERVIRAFDLAELEYLGSYNQLIELPGAIAVNHSGTLLAASPLADGPVVLASQDSGDIARLSGLGRVRDIAFSSDDALAAFSGAGQVVVANVESGQIGVGVAALPFPGVHSIAFGGDGRNIAAARPDAIAMWSLDPGPMPAADPHEQFDAAPGVTFNDGIAFSQDGRLLAAGLHRSDGTGGVLLWDVESREIGTALDHAENVRELVFSHDGEYLAGIGDDKLVRVWDVAARKCLLIFHMGAPNRLAFSPVEPTLAAVGRSLEIRKISRDWNEPDYNRAIMIDVD